MDCKCKIDKHEWKVHWENLKAGNGCPECKTKKLIIRNYNTLENIKSRLLLINSDLKILDSKYIDCHTKLALKCENNHVFKRSWIDLISVSTNCPECSRLNYQGGYSIGNAERKKQKWLKRKAIVYIVNLYNDEENFFKIGITNKTVLCRIKYRTPYNFKILNEIKTNMYDGTYIEHELGYRHKRSQYIPKKLFDGWTECYGDINSAIISKYTDHYNNLDNAHIYNKHHLICDGMPENINILSKKDLISLLVKLNSYMISAKDLGVLEEYSISGYKVEEWIEDIKAKIEIMSHKDEERLLKNMEDKLSKLLSEGKKVELEINEIESMLGN